VYLRDVAEIVDGFEDPLTLARLDNNTVVSIQVIKKAGENLINASEKIFKLLEDSKLDGTLPPGLNVDLSNDQSEWIKKMVNNLENSIVIAIFFVVLVLYFFLGTRNALFVGIAIPTSMTLSIVILNLMGSTINMMVLFGLVLALGMLVDNAIVVIENTFRFTGKGFSANEAAKRGTGEVAIAITASTATTLGAFIPLAFWPGMMGAFMKVLPVTLIIVLSSSLFVALVIIPVFAARYYKTDSIEKVPVKKVTFKKAIISLCIAIVALILKINFIAFFAISAAALILANYYFLNRLSEWFRNSFLAILESFYRRMIEFALKGKRPTQIIIFTVALMIMTMLFFNIRQPKVDLFPDNEPSYFNIFAELPVGSDINATDEIVKEFEKEVFKILEPHKKVVKSVLTTIGKGVVGENEFPVGNTPNKGMITVSFVDYELRKGISTSSIMKEMSKKITHKIPGILVTISKNMMG
ncbi:MAG: efflux RND transporter permease subunit, partial [Candidatus Aminicenantes bacterium]|nr:efflux RND transporter permease subunit [Candidatus Aminicenantes bacterium]